MQKGGLGAARGSSPDVIRNQVGVECETLEIDSELTEEYCKRVAPMVQRASAGTCGKPIGQEKITHVGSRSGTRDLGRPFLAWICPG